MTRRLPFWIALLSLGCVAALRAAAGGAPPALVFYAAMPGHETRDKDKTGGNPFATALIDLIALPDLTLAGLPAALSERTASNSGGFQAADVPRSANPPDWRFRLKPEGETRVALVAVVSDYSASTGAKSLPGAAFDARRVAAALQDAGFVTNLVIDADREAFTDTLAAFGQASRNADVALIYTTGHGVEIGNTTHLLLGDFPVPEGEAALGAHALTLDSIAAVPAARLLNMVFYGGCRNNPFARKAN